MKNAPTEVHFFMCSVDLTFLYIATILIKPLRSSRPVRFKLIWHLFQTPWRQSIHYDDFP